MSQFGPIDLAPFGPRRCRLKFAPYVLLTAAAACSPPADTQAQAQAAPKPPPPVAASPASARPIGGAPQLAFPIDCKIGKTCEVQNYVDRDPGPGAKDYRCGSNTYDAHGGVDIRLLDMAAQGRGVAVLAAAPGRVARLRDGVADVSVRTIGKAALAGQDCGNGVVVDHGGGWETQYCHLAKGSIGVKVGDQVAAGQPIARVGLSGNTEYPHLHVTVRKDGTMVDPGAPSVAADACDVSGAGPSLWTPDAAAAMTYKEGAMLNVGFAAAPVTMESIEAGGIAAPTTASPMLIAYARAINLRPGDIQELTIQGPDGAKVASGAQEPLDRAKAQYMSFVGKRASAGTWEPGVYTGRYIVRRDGRVVLERTFNQAL